MGWNKDGSTIRANYLYEYEIVGKVIESRVRYGGEVSYWVQLDNPLFLFGTYRDKVIVSENQVTMDFGVIENGETV